MISLVQNLCMLDGISGDETRVAQWLYDRAAPHADAIRIDRNGSLLVFRKGASSEKTRMLCAHMDEVGFLVRAALNDGSLAVEPVGGIDPRVCVGKPVRVLCADAVRSGVFSVVPVHLASAEEKQNAPSPDTLRVDIGAESREAAEALAPPGTAVVFDSAPAGLFGDGCFAAKAIDDRVGCAVLLHLLETNVPCAYDTWFVFSVKEEVGGHGARTAAFTLSPDEAYILEGTTAADLPGVPAAEQVCRMGGGVVLVFMDRGTIYDRAMLHTLRTLADANGIPHQTKQKIAGGTDAASIHVTRGGIPCAGLAIPVRYLHAPRAVASVADMEAMARLADALLRTPSA